jgi:hypothetical protein
MTQLDTVARKVRKLYQKLHNWRAVGAELGITCGMAYRVAHGYEPKEARIRYRLGLPALAPAPVCRRCGEVHTTQRCTKNRRHRTE